MQSGAQCSAQQDCLPGSGVRPAPAELPRAPRHRVDGMAPRALPVRAEAKNPPGTHGCGAASHCNSQLCETDAASLES